jgi:hypothetical protein
METSRLASVGFWELTPGPKLRVGDLSKSHLVKTSQMAIAPVGLGHNLGWFRPCRFVSSL